MTRKVNQSNRHEVFKKDANLRFHRVLHPSPNIYVWLRCMACDAHIKTKWVTRVNYYLHADDCYKTLGYLCAECATTRIELNQETGSLFVEEPLPSVEDFFGENKDG